MTPIETLGNGENEMNVGEVTNEEMLAHCPSLDQRHIIPPTRKMYLLSIKESTYSGEYKPLTLVDSEETANTLTVLIERSGARAKMTVVPVWPAIGTDD